VYEISDNQYETVNTVSSEQCFHNLDGTLDDDDVDVPWLYILHNMEVAQCGRGCSSNLDFKGSRTRFY
jgi:hypothetical protein